jgi:hypothetical protein
MNTPPPSGPARGPAQTLAAEPAQRLEELAARASAASTAASEASFADALRAAEGVLKMPPSRPITGP